MSTATVTLTAPTIELQPINPAAPSEIHSRAITVEHDETPLQTELTPAQSSRTFGVAPLTTIERHSKFLITALIVWMNVIQVRTPLIRVFVTT